MGARSHVFKTGGEYRRAIVNSFNDQLARGRLNFDSLADFLAGKVSTSGTAVCAARPGANFHQQLRPVPAGRLENHTAADVEFGVRYEYLGVFGNREIGSRTSSDLRTGLSR